MGTGKMKKISKNVSTSYLFENIRITMKYQTVSKFAEGNRSSGEVKHK
jgi:hypothetical protein